MLLNNLRLDGKEHELAGELSGGMQRRLNLMLSMVHDPKILILDEPFVGLDIQSRFYLGKIIRSFAYKEGKAVMVSTHNMNEAEKLADRIAFMDNGNLLKIDAPPSLQYAGESSGIIEVKNRKRSLEDVFIEITGRRLDA